MIFNFHLGRDGVLSAFSRDSFSTFARKLFSTLQFEINVQHIKAIKPFGISDIWNKFMKYFITNYIRKRLLLIILNNYSLRISC